MKRQSTTTALGDPVSERGGGEEAREVCHALALGRGSRVELAPQVGLASGHLGGELCLRGQ